MLHRTCRVLVYQVSYGPKENIKNVSIRFQYILKENVDNIKIKGNEYSLGIKPDGKGSILILI